MTHLFGAVVSGLDLPPCELHAARLDGELFAVDDSFLPIDTTELPRHRAEALALRLPPRFIAELGTAAWIYGARSSQPMPLEVCSDAAARYRLVGQPGLTVREVVLAPSDTVVLGRLAVTSPLRTVVDLARTRIEFGEQDAAAVRMLAGIGRFALGDTLDYLDARAHLPAKRRARDRLLDCL